MTDDRNIPEATKRAVRQECHFGCVICGMPVFEYDHIEPFASVKKHVAANLALLCPNHHRDKTSGRLAVERVAKARGWPFNASSPRTAPYGLEASQALEVRVGSNVATGTNDAPDHHVIWINGKSFVTIHREGEAYTYSALVTDAGGQVLVEIDHGALTVATDVWDYAYEGRLVTVRSRAGVIVFEAELSDRTFAIHRGAFIDTFDTGVIVQPDGAAAFTMSGLEVGRMEGSELASNANGAIAVVRCSCFKGPPPSGLGFVKSWSADFEQRAEELRLRMAAGEPGPYPPGLEGFRVRRSEP